MNPVSRAAAWLLVCIPMSQALQRSKEYEPTLERVEDCEGDKHEECNKPHECDCKQLELKIRVPPIEIGKKNINVLVIGDSTFSETMGAFESARDVLGQRGISTALYRTKEVTGFCGSSFLWTQCTEQLLNLDQSWDLVTFNWGLHDINPHGYGYISTDQYYKNLMKIYWDTRHHIKETATVVFQTTLPVAPDAHVNLGDGDNVVITRTNDDVIAINEAMARLGREEMREGDSVHDLYQQVVEYCHDQGRTDYPFTENCPQFQNEGDVHPSEEGKALMGQFIADSVLTALGL